jgi:probable HAF family extracellular repeat protein
MSTFTRRHLAQTRTRPARLVLRATIGCTAAAALALAVPAAQASRYIFEDVINNNDVTFNQELGINNAGVIAGYFGSGAAGHPNKGYLVINTLKRIVQDDFINENFPNSVQTQVTGLNNRGATVGFWSHQNRKNMTNNNFGFVNFGGPLGLFININNPNTGTIGKIKTNQLLGVNDLNTAVGFYIDTAGATHGYKYLSTVNLFSSNIDDPNGVGTTTATAINNFGQVVGFFIDKSNVTHGFFDKNGVFTTIDGPNATSTMLLGLNNFGIAVGVEVDKKGKMHGLICSVTTAICQTLDDPHGKGTTTFNGINDLGQIVGFYTNGTNTIGLLANPASFP